MEKGYRLAQGRWIKKKIWIAPKIGDEKYGFTQESGIKIIDYTKGGNERR